MGRRLRLLAAASGVVVVVGLAAGCGEESASDAADGGGDLGSAWLAQPIPVRADVIQAAVRACRTDDATLIPQTSTAVVADARGEGRIAVVFAGPREQVFLCLLTASPDGGLSLTTAWGGDRHSAEGPLFAGEVRPEEPQAATATATSGPASTLTTATGRVGRSVAGVDLTLASGQRVRASTAVGWYAAWWPTADRVIGYQALDGAGQPFGPVQH